LFDDGALEKIGFDDPNPEPADGGIQVNDIAVTIEPMVESGIRQPVVSPPKVFSRASDDRSSTHAPVDEPRPPTGTGTGESVAGPGLGVVLAAVLLTLVVALIAAVAVLSGNGGSGTEAAEGTEPAAPADGADAAIDQDLQQVGDDNPVAGQRAGAQETAGARNTAGAENTAGAQNTASPAVAALARELAEGRVDLTSIRFVPGTVEPTEAGRRLIEELAEAVLVSGGQPVSVVVRTYSEAGAADNQALSEAQAEALVQLMIAQGVPADQLVAVGQGSGPLSLQQPVPDFVVVNPELGDAVFKRVIADIGTFTLGSRPGGTESGQSSELRLESLAVVDGVGQALVNFEDSTIGFAGYSYFEADNESNRARAGQASDAVARRLAEVHGIGPDRVTIITPGAAPYVVRPEVGNHIWIRAGARTITAFEVAGIDAAAIDFDPGSPAPSAASGAVLDQLAAALAASTDTLVIDVRTYSEATGASNMELSQARADAIAAYLVEDGGIEAGRLRAFGSGASSYFTDDGGSHVTLTVIP
jgi:outer membrane protein OmpA-like peptidoglycan-associated protein